jgi:RNA polymerase sigma-70 factor (ECF subfamily)
MSSPDVVPAAPPSSSNRPGNEAQRSGRALLRVAAGRRIGLVLLGVPTARHRSLMRDGGEVAPVGPAVDSTAAGAGRGDRRVDQTDGSASDGGSPAQLVVDVPPVEHQWVAHLSTTGPARDAAVARLHELMLRAARHRVSRMPEAAGLGAARRDELVHAAADSATVAALSRLDRFEGRSKFSTWAYKFGILEAGAEVRRSVWRDRESRLHDVAEPTEQPASSPEAYVEGRDLARAMQKGLSEALTAHQRRIAIALLVDEVPIDVLAERLDTNRNALYKTLHDARRRLQAYLFAEGFMPGGATKKVTR